MQDTGAPWSPQVGNHVLVSATGDIGVVMEITDAGDGRRFVVAIWPAPDSAQHVAQTVMHRVCRLDELAPARMP